MTTLTETMTIRAADGTSIAYARDGDGDGAPVLALHGLSGMKSSFAPILAAAGGGRSTWAMDFRGHGESDHTPGGYRLADYLSDAQALLETIGEPTVLVGHSLGGIVSARLAQDRHPLVKAVFLEDPPQFIMEAEVFGRTPYAPLFTVLEQAVSKLQADGAGP